MRKPKNLNPKTLWIVGDSNRQITPSFYHEELARAAHRELSKDREGLEVRSRKAEVVQAGFSDALSVLSRESRWLDMAQRDRKNFAALCEGWLSALKIDVTQAVSPATPNALMGGE